MPSAPAPATRPATQRLYERLDRSTTRRSRSMSARALLDRFFALPSGREKPGRFWRIDFESILPDAGAIDDAAPASTRRERDPRVLACDLATAAREHPALLARAFGTTGIAATKFGALATAFARPRRVRLRPADARVRRADRDTLSRRRRRRASSRGRVVLAERGARATDRRAPRPRDAGAFVCGAAEIVTEEHADVTYRGAAECRGDARAIFTHARRAPGPRRDASRGRAPSSAAALAAGDVSRRDRRARASQAQSHGALLPARLAARRPRQHASSTAPATRRRETLVKSAASGRGQARYPRQHPHRAARARQRRAPARRRAVALQARAHRFGPRARNRAPTTSRRITARPSARSTKNSSST